MKQRSTHAHHLSSGFPCECNCRDRMLLQVGGLTSTRCSGKQQISYDVTEFMATPAASCSQDCQLRGAKRPALQNSSSQTTRTFGLAFFASIASYSSCNRMTDTLNPKNNVMQLNRCLLHVM